MLAGSPDGQLVGLRFIGSRKSCDRITGSNHGGLVVANLSTIAVGTGTNSFTQVSGNGTDLFCDSKSVITGGSAIAGASTDNCGNLLPSDTESIP